MKAIFLLFLTLNTTWVFGQHIRTFKVTQYTIDDRNFDKEAQEFNVALIFYECGENKLCFMNQSRKGDTYSFGQVIDLKTSDILNDSSFYKTEEYRFQWYYFNSYDDQHGTSDVIFRKTYTRDGLEFYARIEVHNPKSVLELKGYYEPLTF